ncbi:MAG: RDD family protein [Bacteroidetes bacterium]|nr:RDD family protein [Bacteroidota bacterium]
MSIIQISTPFNIDIEFEQAEFHKRLLAYIIDFVILFMYMFAMFTLLFDGFDVDISEFYATLALIIPPMLLYTLLTELFFNGQTIGKKILRIKVVSLDGGEPTLGQYLLRAFFRFYEWGAIIFWIFFREGVGTLIFMLGGVVCIIVIAVTARSQRLGDLAAGTVVVNTRTKLTIDDTIFMNINTSDYKVMFPSVMRLSDRDINTIKGVVSQAAKSRNYDMCNRVAMKVKDVLKINTNMYPDQFLEKLLEDYNYLATKE